MKKGSALVIALLVVAVLATVAFTAGQIFVSQSVANNAYLTGSQALAAAQAGAEEGLRRYKINPVTQTPPPGHIGDGSYSVDLVVDAATATITARGDVGSIRRTVTVTVDRATNIATYAD